MSTEKREDLNVTTERETISAENNCFEGVAIDIANGIRGRKYWMSTEIGQ